ncbi:3'phosphatase, 5'polynucleotide kinase [Klebsiella phage CPRSA]|nr:3'phosphatase, 5'polynucleotide kinase [Klebsiella phage CPRSA]
MNLFMTIGVPGSGKTTWAHEKARELGNTVTISRDICVALCIMLVKVLADTNTPKRKKK